MGGCSQPCSTPACPPSSQNKPTTTLWSGYRNRDAITLQFINKDALSTLELKKALRNYHEGGKKHAMVAGPAVKMGWDELSRFARVSTGPPFASASRNPDYVGLGCEPGANINKTTHNSSYQRVKHTNGKLAPSQIRTRWSAEHLATRLFRLRLLLSCGCQITVLHLSK